VPCCVPKTTKKGVKKGVYEHWPLAIETKRNRMKKTQHKQVADPDGFDEGTYRLEVCNESFSTSNKVVPTKTNERALAAGGAQ
jgi:hypothetical protein